ncbi:hypothetical protein MJG53_019350 [Ovis ammon polii x Ovis aries]|uniref:Uncharacterized protein n=1 Tax=Ovis ammon polii x Ovis aries TaxID=2918886 RepID=A0ACB9U2X0_9CETA|nr:hypothetical protein MJG53_019350 [Ovis ammon polii x Ovis aries]
MSPISAEASRGQSHLTTGIFNGSFTPLLQLKKFPDIPVSTREETRGSRSHPGEPRFQPLARDEGSFPCFVGEEFPAFPYTSQEEALSTEKARGTPGSCHHSKSPPDVSVHSRGTCFPCTALTFKPRIDSHHVCTWDSPVESLVGKPLGKDSRENHRSFDPRGGLRDTAATALEESASACPYSRRGLTPLGRPQRYPKIHVSTGEESSSSGPDSTQGLRPRHRREWIPERPPRSSHGDWPFLIPPERVPEGPVVSREHLPQLEKIQEVLPSRRDEAHFR